MLGWHSIFMFLTMVVVAKGVKHGLEKATKFMMPALYVILFILVIYAFSYGNFNKGFHFLFDFTHSKITTSVLMAALGHTFFTLAFGVGAMAMYAAYVPRNVDLSKKLF